MTQAEELRRLREAYRRLVGDNSKWLWRQGKKVAAAILLFSISSLHAEPFSYPKYTKIIGSIKWGKDFVRTSTASRVELRFVDGTLARIGSNSHFRFVIGSREAILESGTLLFYLPRGSGGAAIYAGSIVASAIEGDFEVQNINNQSKVICLSGKVFVHLRSNLKEDSKLKPGQMIDVHHGVERIPATTVIDLLTLIQTSALMKMGDWPNQALIEANAKKQKGVAPISVPLSDASTTANQVAQIEQRQQQQQLQQQQIEAVLEARREAVKQLVSRNQSSQSQLQVQPQPQMRSQQAPPVIQPQPSPQPSQPQMPQQQGGNQGRHLGQLGTQPGQAKQ